MTAFLPFRNEGGRVQAKRARRGMPPVGNTAWRIRAPPLFASAKGGRYERNETQGAHSTKTKSVV